MSAPVRPAHPEAPLSRVIEVEDPTAKRIAAFVLVTFASLAAFVFLPPDSAIALTAIVVILASCMLLDCRVNVHGPSRSYYRPWFWVSSPSPAPVAFARPVSVLRSRPPVFSNFGGHPVLPPVGPRPPLMSSFGPYPTGAAGVARGFPVAQGGARVLPGSGHFRGESALQGPGGQPPFPTSRRVPVGRG